MSVDVEKGDFFALANKNEIVRFAKSSMEGLFLKVNVLYQKKCKENILML
jgi:hypothetical protein